MNGFLPLLEAQFPEETYLTRWYTHRERLHELPDDPPSEWAPRAVKSLGLWLQSLPGSETVLARQETRWKRLLEDYFLGPQVQDPLDFPEPYPLQEFPQHLCAFLSEIYPDHRIQWEFFCHVSEKNALSPNGRWKPLQKLWDEVKKDQERHRKNLLLAKELPPFHARLTGRLRKLLEAEKALRSVFHQADVGWDLDQGDWENLNLQPLVRAAEILTQEKEIQRIAELLGRDYRARTRPPVNPPPSPPTRLEPGKTEIQGFTIGRNPGDTPSQELALLAFEQTEILFFQKLAEGRLLNWDYSQPSEIPAKNFQKAQEHLAQNERGPMILVLDTSGSMRDKPEEVAKTAVLALVKIALEEKRRCFLINFSSEIRTLEVSDLKTHLKDLLDFLAFSFHGGTDLPPALREALKMMGQQNYKEADVLVISDFAVPKVPGPLRTLIRQHQESRGSRFYALTVSARPLNDILNIFDAAWTYNIHHKQQPGIDPATVFPL